MGRSHSHTSCARERRKLHTVVFFLDKYWLLGLEVMPEAHDAALAARIVRLAYDTTPDTAVWTPNFRETLGGLKDTP